MGLFQLTAIDSGHLPVPGQGHVKQKINSHLPGHAE